MLSKTDHARITEAIAEAKSKSAGEIFCVLTHEVSRYREVPLAWAAIAAFVLPPLFTFAMSALATAFAAPSADGCVM